MIYCCYTIITAGLSLKHDHVVNIVTAGVLAKCVECYRLCDYYGGCDT